MTIVLKIENYDNLRLLQEVAVRCDDPSNPVFRAVATCPAELRHQNARSLLVDIGAFSAAAVLFIRGGIAHRGGPVLAYILALLFLRLVVLSAYRLSHLYGAEARQMRGEEPLLVGVEVSLPWAVLGVLAAGLVAL